MPLSQPGLDTSNARSGWSVPPPWTALALEWVPAARAGPAVLGAVRHAAHAYQVAWPQAPDHAWLVAMANGYLGALQALLRQVPEDQAAGSLTLVPAQVLEALADLVPARAGVLHWLPLGTAIDGTTLSTKGTPHCTHWVHRVSDPPGEGSLVLLAGRSAGGWPLGGDMGLRIVVQVRAGTARIHGVVCSGLDRAANALQTPGHQGTAATPETLIDEVKRSLKAYLATEDEVWITDLVGEDGSGHTLTALRARGYTYHLPDDPHQQRPAGMRSRKVMFWAELNNAYKVLRLNQRQTVRTACAAAAQVHVGVVPPSGSNGRRPPRLNATRQSLALPARTVLSMPGPGGQTLLEVHGANPARQRTDRAPRQTADEPPSRVLELALTEDPGHGGKAAPGRRRAPAPTPSRLPGDQDAALHAYLRGQHLFDRMQAYGLSPAAYFRFARLPLVLRPRAGFSGVPDGDQPAAEVRPFFSGNFTPRSDGHPAARRPQLLVKFGSADSNDREVLEGSLHEPTRPRTQYLGVAADARWAWHEFGHVLCHASTGELEFEFAHSVGDALAAITCDPLSSLADEHGRRGETFPWIQVPGRRHDRQARLGYCWCGRRNLLRLQRSNGQRQRFQHGYFEEQLLSSALFRLYQCLGGATAGSAPEAMATRLAASDYTVYLVMRALALLGPDNLATARTPNQFVSALIDADFGSAQWQVSAAWAAPQGQPRQLRRAGGQLAKVIRWAFEQQGLYATDDPQAVVEGVGRAPLVDLFLPDGRLPGPGELPDAGAYWPVPLHALDSAPSAPDERPRWWGAPTAVALQGRQLRLQLGNRGRLAAQGVTLGVWVADQALNWTPLIERPLPGPVAPAQSQAVTLELGTPPDLQDLRWLLVRVQNDADPSIHSTDQARWPDDAQALMHLVSSDNNLGLWPGRDLVATGPA